ncbi:ATP-binding protein [Desulfothermus okinawensis JCM 13304]
MTIPRLTPDPAHPFQLAKFLSWTSLILIVGSGLFLTVIISNYAKETVLKKDKQFAKLLAENLNHQIYQRFLLPTVLGFGRVELRKKEQYERLDLVVQSTIHGFKVLNIKIYDLKGMVSYSTNKDLLGTKKPMSIFKDALSRGIQFKVIKKRGFNIWPFKLEKKSVVLVTLFPLRVERELFPKNAGEVVGILEFSQDISEDYETIYYFQFLITIAVFFSSLILFILLYVVILRADRILQERIKEKEELERAVYQNEKLASMGRMVATISHEIKNPLGIIQSSAEMLSKKFANEKGAASKLSKAIFEESKRLSNIVNDFLDYARPKEPKLEEIDLVTIVNECIAFFKQEAIKRDIEFKIDLPETLTIKGDKNLLYRAIYNIINNAMDAIDAHGKIEIKWDKDSLIIKDSGPGFEEPFMEKYLEPFFTTKDFGTGLGLPIAYNILKGHGVEIELKNENGGLVKLKFPD